MPPIASTGRPDLDAFEHLLKVGDCPYLGELGNLVRYTRHLEAEMEGRVLVGDVEWEAINRRLDVMREALEKIAAYWQPHTGLNNVLDSIAEIAREALSPTSSFRGRA